VAKPSRPDKPTLVSLARDLGVSRQTVSNVINNPAVVHPDTRRRVQAAIDAAGYRPSLVGRALRTRRSMAIGLRLYPATDGINGSVKDRFLHNLADQAQRHGYRITLLTAADAGGEVAALEELHHVSAIDGCVLTDTPEHDPRPAMLTGFGVPFVVFGRPWGEDGTTHSWVDVDGATGTRAATRHLRTLGHTRIGFLGWPGGPGLGPERRDGWLQGMAGLPDADRWSAAVSESVSEGARAAAELIARGVTAIVCASDSLALGAAEAMRQAGQGSAASVPVVGFDDTPVAQALGLSSVAQPVEEAARATIEILLGLLGQPPAAPRQVLLPSTFIPRNLPPPR